MSSAWTHAGIPWHGMAPDTDLIIRGGQVKTKKTVTEHDVGVGFKPSCLAATIALLAGALSGNALAMQIPTSNPDLEVHWDNTVRYNAGWRMEKQNKDFLDSPFYDDTESKMDRGDMVTNRLDLVSELDVVWRRNHAIRVSAAAWYDDVYQGNAKTQGPGTGNFINNRYNSYTSRYIGGLSGEILDAFVFTRFNLGDAATVALRAGQHNVYWGESLFSIGNSIAYSQGPVDTIKSATSPGAEAKELFLPLPQISAQIQFDNDLSIGLQYLLDWEAFRMVPGGTYFGPSDGSRSDLGAAPAVSFPGGIPNGKDFEPSNKRGEWGVNARWSPWWLNGTAGIYYRKFHEKLPWSFQQIGMVDLGGGPMALPTQIRLGYARDTELYGLSLTTTMATISIAGELSYRKNTALVSTSGYTVAGADLDNPTYSEIEGARGDSIHALINGIYLLPRTSLWTGGQLQAELTYNRLDKVTKNPHRYNARGYDCTTPYSSHCVSRDAWGVQVGFTPEWPQALPGWDLSMPTSLAYGIEGNSPTLGGTNEGVYNYSIGIAGKYMNKHNFTLRWVDSYSKYKVNPASGIVTTDHTIGAPVQNNHGWISFSYRTSF